MPPVYNAGFLSNICVKSVECTFNLNCHIKENLAKTLSLCAVFTVVIPNLRMNLGGLKMTKGTKKKQRNFFSTRLCSFPLNVLSVLGFFLLKYWILSPPQPSPLNKMV